MTTPLSGFTSRLPRPENPRKRRMLWKRWARRTLLLLFGTGLALAIALAWMPRPVPVEIAQVESGMLRVTVDEDGQARVRDRYLVSAPLGGSMGRIVLEPGDVVQQGHVIASIVPPVPALLDERTRQSSEARLASALAAQRQARALGERARAALDFAETDGARTRELFQRQSVARATLDRALLAERTARAELDSAKFALKIADHEAEMARAALRHIGSPKRGLADGLEITAPIAGRVLKVLHESEGVVQPGTPLLELGDPAALEITVDVLTSDAVRIAPGARADVAGWGGDPLEGRVRHVEPSAFTRLSALGVEEQRVNVQIDLVSPRERWQRLGDGYRVEVEIAVWESERVAKVPASAVFRRGQGWAAFRVEAGVAHLTPIEIDHRTSREVEVVRGLEPGARVIAYPSDRVADSVQVAQR
jgi:HlyD family secretion protein